MVDRSRLMVDTLTRQYLFATANPPVPNVHTVADRL
jgi:hypothetical protein